jgi:hypothetical protein
MARLSIVGILLALPALAAAQLQLVSTSPALNATVAPSSAIAVTFDRAVDTATVGVGTFRVFGQWSGAVRGTYAFSNGNKTVTLTPDDPFSAGEFVFVNLSHDMKAADTSSLRAAGYAFQFMTATAPSAGSFSKIDEFSNRTGGAQTRIYGASAGDLDGDRFLDLATVNEVSADVRVFLNRGDGSGLFQSMLPREQIGVEASPNCTADFDNDGHLDLCVSAATTEDVWILLGAGDGGFKSKQSVAAGDQPHGIVPLDVDGDGDLDIVGANVGSNNLALYLNDGSGHFGTPTFVEAGVNGEYGLAIADMNGDGITDVVVGGRNGEQVVTMLGNGNGTFTASTPRDCGGAVWVVVLGDVNGDGKLDAAPANDGDGTIGILLGNGDGTFAPVSTIPIGSHVPSVDLGDLDGDGDLDLVPSSFGGGFWRWYRNDGTGAFTLVEQFEAPANPSCAVLFDADNDGDLDLGLTDEIADVVIIMRNDDQSGCTLGPSACRQPLEAGKSKLTLKDKTPDTSDGLSWKWTKGEITAKADFGDPTSTTDYELCLYENGALVKGFRVPAGDFCRTKPCWRDIGKGFTYKDPDRTPNGIMAAKLVEGLIAGKANVKVKGKGGLLGMPDVGALTGILDVQLQPTGGGPCFGATYSPPFKKNDGITLLALSDAPLVTTTSTTSTTSTSSTTLPPAPVWSAIHSQVIAVRCAGCHGGSGGLSGLNDCNTAHAMLVNVASTELPTMDRVEPGDPTTSWIMQKLDGTQGWFTAQCNFNFCGSQMPLIPPTLTQETRDAIRQWITDGALNDCP